MHIKKPNKAYAGFSLTEMMVALVINLLLFSALITLFASNLTHYQKTLDSNRLTQQLQSALTLMSNDIRRAGYWGNASSNIGSSPNANPFMTSGTDIATYLSNTCILFSYDKNDNGSLPAISTSYDDERYGYRLNNQTIQTRPYGASFNCNASATEWETITDTNIQITSLTFTLITQTVPSGGSSSDSILMRSVDISITGRLSKDNTITRTLTQHIRIMNDKFTP
jgi:prepilin peptidase dependent protein B